MTFKELNLHPQILQAIDACGYTKPTPVQAKSIPAILDGRDVVASAQTGTGKTAAYVLPALHLLATKKSGDNAGVSTSSQDTQNCSDFFGPEKFKRRQGRQGRQGRRDRQDRFSNRREDQNGGISNKPRILILSPTRELAIQITKVIRDYGKFMRVNIANFVGGVPYSRQLQELSRPIDIVIATPGRLMDHMKSRRINLSAIEMLVLDEADRMLDMGFIQPIKQIVQSIPQSRQTLLFSATASDKLMSIVRNLLKNPVRINISQEKTDVKLIKQEIHLMNDTHRKKKLLEILLSDEKISKALIFSATKHNAKRLTTQIGSYGHKVGAMHGDLKQNARNKTLDSFRRGSIKFLVATDVAARGIDVTDISHVINYDLPKYSEDYVHRIGRTGRAGKTGVAISMALHSEKRYLQNIERYIGVKLLRAN